MGEKPVYGIEWDNLVIDYEKPIRDKVLESMTLAQLFEMPEHMEYLYLHYRGDAYWAEKGMEPVRGKLQETPFFPYLCQADPKTTM